VGGQLDTKNMVCVVVGWVVCSCVWGGGGGPPQAPGQVGYLSKSCDRERAPSAANYSGMS
jgi:hypothetical protein